MLRRGLRKKLKKSFHQTAAAIVVLTILKQKSERIETFRVSAQSGGERLTHPHQREELRVLEKDVIKNVLLIA